MKRKYHTFSDKKTIILVNDIHLQCLKHSIQKVQHQVPETQMICQNISQSAMKKNTTENTSNHWQNTFSQDQHCIMYIGMLRYLKKFVFL
jgi:hypothetical protein